MPAETGGKSLRTVTASVFVALTGDSVAGALPTEIGVFFAAGNATGSLRCRFAFAAVCAFAAFGVFFCAAVFALRSFARVVVVTRVTARLGLAAAVLRRLVCAAGAFAAVFTLRVEALALAARVEVARLAVALLRRGAAVLPVLLFRVATALALSLPFAFEPGDFAPRAFGAFAAALAVLVFVEVALFLTEGIRGTLLLGSALETELSGGGKDGPWPLVNPTPADRRGETGEAS